MFLFISDICTSYDILIKESIKLGRIIVVNKENRNGFISPNYPKYYKEFPNHTCNLKRSDDIFENS